MVPAVTQSIPVSKDRGPDAEVLAPSRARGNRILGRLVGAIATAARFGLVDEIRFSGLVNSSFRQAVLERAAATADSDPASKGTGRYDGH